MPKRVVVELRGLRRALKERIESAERGISTGEAAVKAAKSAGRARSVKTNRKNLTRAKKLVRKLKRIQSAVDAECCNFQTMNCDFIFD